MLRTSALLLSAAILLSAQNGGPVEGVVVNRVTGVGIGGVAVVLYTRQAIQYEATTDDYGHFVTTRTEPGVYQVRYEKPRFKQFREDPVSPLRVGGNRVRLRLEMTPLVTLRGRVLNGDGKPALRAQVRMGSFFAFVDARGEFEFDRLEPGSYTLMAEPGPSPPTESRIEPVRTAFPFRVVVRGDKDLSGYEIRIQSAPMHRVRGVVRDEAGRPVLATLRLLEVIQRERQVTVDPRSDSFSVVGPEVGDGLLQASTTSAEDGSFEFPSVPSGEWRIAVDAAMRRGEAGVSVVQSDIDALQIRVSVPANFNMNVTVDWGGAPAAASLTLLGRTVLVPDKAMRMENVRPGRYRVMPSAMQGYYPVSARLGGREVLGQSVEIDSGSRELRIVYKAASGSVTGSAPAASTVVLLPKQAPAFGRIARCNPNGVFSISSVAPGEYYVSAFEGFDASYLTDPDLLRKIAADGPSVTVATGLVDAPVLTALKWPE